MERIVIYVMNIVPLNEDAVFKAQFARMHQARQEKILHFSHRMDQNRSLGAGILLAQGLLSYGIDYRDSVIKEDQNGKPYLAGVSCGSGCGRQTDTQTYRNIHFCLSHSGEYAAAAFGPSAVGIDLERVRGCSDAIIRRCCSEEEQKALSHCENIRDREELFLRYWTIKESASKWGGQGMRLPFRDIRLRNDNMVEIKEQEKSSVCFLHELEIRDGKELYRIAVCAQTEHFVKEPVWIRL